MPNDDITLAGTNPVETVKEGLSQAVRKLLRPLVRLLIKQGISHPEFAELASQVFVESALRDFSDGDSGETDRSRTAVLTGLSIEEVDQVLIDTLRAEPVFRPQGEQLARVLQAWYTEQQFIGPYGIPLEIPWQVEDPHQPSFSKLVSLHVEMEPRYVLQEFLRAGAIVETEPGFYKVVRRDYEPPALDPAALERFGTVVSNFIQTIVGNIEKEKSTGNKFERIVWADDAATPEEVAFFDSWIKRQGQRFLEQIDDWFIAQIRDSERNLETSPGATVNTGVGIYHYESDIEDEIAFAEYLAEKGLSMNKNKRSGTKEK